MEEKSKCGEIFRLNEGKYIFICFHCGDEFESASKIVKHIETHFQWNQPLPFAAAFDLSVNVKKELDEDIFDTEYTTPAVDDFVTTKLEKIEDTEQHQQQENKQIESTHRDDDDEDSDYWPGDLFDLAGDDFVNESDTPKPEEKPVTEVKRKGRRPKAGDGGSKKKWPKRLWVPRKKTSTYICEPCGAIYEYKNDMRLHILDNHAKKIKTLECDVCGSKFKSRFSLKKHLRRHRPEDYTVSEPMFCNRCDRKFPFVNTYNKHMAAHILNESKTPVVPSTSSTSTSSAVAATVASAPVVKVKREKVDRSKPAAKKPAKRRPRLPNQAICSQCGKGFKTKCALKKHFYIHTGERPYVCEVCNKAYYTNSYLKIHRRIHTGEKPYQCSQCGKKFVAANVLNEHLKWHNNSRPYKCTQCPKTFLLLENLKRHEPKHNQIRPVCHICNKSFSLDRTYRQHMLLHEGIGKHKCRYCDASFSSSTSRQKHEHVMHRINDTFMSQTQLSSLMAATAPQQQQQQQQQPHQPQPLHPATGFFH